MVRTEIFRSVRRPVLMLAGVALLTAAVLGARVLFAGGGPWETEPNRVGREDLVMTVEVTGELAAVRATEIGPPPVKDLWDYKISFLAPESAFVKKGQPIIAFDTQALEKILEEKRAEYAEASKQIERKQLDVELQVRAQELTLAEAEAKLGKARLKADVPSDLSGRIESVAARMEVQDLERDVENGRARLEAIRRSGDADLRALISRRDRAKGRVDDLEHTIQSMRIGAPQDGIVIYKTGRRDEKKKIGDSAWAGEKVIELPDLTEMKGKGEVDEADAGQVAVGQKVSIRLEAHPDVDFTGRVRSIGRTVRRRSWRVPIKVYNIDIVLDRTDPTAMRPGMRFRGEIETKRIASVIVAPREAIVLRPSGPMAWVKRGRRYVETTVQLGRANRQFVEIVSGLGEGDLISRKDLRPAEPARTRGPLASGL